MYEEDLKSEFNSNKASLIRVDAIMNRCHEAKLLHNWEFWFNNLWALRTEARYKMIPKEKIGKAARAECAILWPKVINARKLFSLQESLVTEGNYVKVLDEFELFVTDFMGRKGMLLTDSDDTRGL